VNDSGKFENREMLFILFLKIFLGDLLYREDIFFIKIKKRYFHRSFILILLKAAILFNFLKVSI
jgi:hypothetical protein